MNLLVNYGIQASGNNDDAAIEYMNATGGDIFEYELSGKFYRSHTFTTSENFVVTELSEVDVERNKVDYLIIAGGGAGGGGLTQRGGGGGAGGYRTTNGTSGGNSSPETSVSAVVGSYPVFIGAGGVGSTVLNQLGGFPGSNSSIEFDTIISSTGGGGGGPGRLPGGSGGSGGGGGGDESIGGAGISGEGHNGGAGRAARSRSGGGGGAGGVGGNATNIVAGQGGNGLANLLRTGSPETRAEGGNGIEGAFVEGVNAQANTGSGGSGGSGGVIRGSFGFIIDSVTEPGGNGGSGIVVIRYEIAPN